ncbi:MAG: NAD(P)-dependent oxidoreductase [Gammaproteobacteria bacterium]|jgi:3-hydroxyisobutyrate dehydrogenase-like beta-hydroxyacid dehydrogenase
MKIGFIGLGNMGAPMARNLVEAGFDLKAFNRTAARAKALGEAGADIVSSPRAAAEGSDLVLTMVADDAALEAVVFADEGVMAGLDAGAAHISMSTISVGLAERLTAEHTGAGQAFVSAPVFGRPDAAAAARLWVVAAGPSDVIERARPVFDALGQGVFELGETPLVANTVKLAGNYMISSMIECFSEASTMVDKAGVDPSRFLDIVNGALFKSPIYENYGKLICSQRFEPPGFRLRHGLKDTRLVLEAARQVEAPMPVASVIHDRYLSAMARGWGDIDWAGLSRVSRSAAGLD